ncbi:RNA ligase family protein [Acanthopleuribacter pedis]|uniref:RNA ligase family protein n=1 Tax=Acanthopleuribacter pedis TaxID=442870 RepID=A0A8J7U7P3_9BACT|nr:RNA ligase family protein [Acanthopleuribacter pedis]MBO1321621.1 RNA ligase family protein [Acanthopleuribacter pedis]
MIKYPRTRHLHGSRLQPGDEDLSQVPLTHLVGKTLVLEEKMDGANAGISFDSDGNLLLQSRGHYLTGGYRERHFNLFKTWAAAHQQALWECLGDHHVLYGEWCYAKHTVYYDQLPHYFLEFDILDSRDGRFLDTPSRHAALAGSPVVSVPVLTTLTVDHRTRIDALVQWIGPSTARGDRWRDHLREDAVKAGVDPDQAARETDTSESMEGLYIKVEENGRVVDRLKWVRHDFLTSVLDSGSHWLDRPIIPNRLAEGVDLFQ